MRTDIKEVYDFVQAHPEVRDALLTAFATSVDNDDEDEGSDSESERITTLLLSDLSEFGDDE